MKKRFVLLLLALLIAFSSCAFAAPRATATPKPLDQSVFPIDGSTAEADLNLRATAYSRGRIVDTLRKGLRVTVTGSEYANDGSVWYAVTTKSSKKTGYLPAEQVILDELPTPTPKPTATPKKTAKPTATPKKTAKPTATPKKTTKATATPETTNRDNAPIVSRGYIGNSDSKIYHLPTCSYLPDRENQVSFSSKAKAESEGYRACQHCKP